MITLLLSFALSGATFAAETKAHAPVVFAHGLGITAHPYEAVPLKRIFAEQGFEVRLAYTPLIGSLEERARVLDSEIRRLVPQGKFHLIGHSMGGLDARLAIHAYGWGERCLSLTTLATPHRGSVVADYVIARLDQGGPVLRELLRLVGDDVRAIEQLTTRYMNEEFNRRVINDPRVRYFSFGFFIPTPASLQTPIPWLWLAHAINAQAGFPSNDALVSVESARWGDDQGAFPGDHYSETGPFPLGGRLIFEETFRRALSNLNRRF